MMDAAEAIPQMLVATNKTACADGRTQERRSPPSTAAAISKVLDDDDLLIEILLRLGFPTTLVRAALVCRRWYHHASDCEFLKQFRKRHPPRLLGFYFQYMELNAEPARFFPVLPQPPEFATVIRHASFNFQSYGNPQTEVLGCRNGRVLLLFHGDKEYAVGVHFPLRPERSVDIAPPPRVQDLEGYFCRLSDFCLDDLLSVEEVDGLSCLKLFSRYNKERTILMHHAYMLRHCDGVWRTDHTMATHKLPRLEWARNGMLVGNKIYMSSFYSSVIAVWDLKASTISTIQLPQGVEKGDLDTMFARPDDASGVYLIHARKLQLQIWLLKGDSWSLVDTICLHEMFASLMMADCRDKDDFFWINHVGDNAEFVVLQMDQCVFYVDIKCRTLHKMHEMTEVDPTLGDIYPFMMIWPPTFPALQDASARFITHQEAPILS